MNWGIKVTIAIVTFMAIMIVMVIISVRQDFYLVTEDYYQQELKYQSQIDKMANYQNLEEKLLVKYNKQQAVAELHFPEGNDKMEGSIHFFRPSNAHLDFKLPLKTNAQGVQVVNLANVSSGLWKIKISWQADGKFYYDEQTVVL